MSTVQAEEIFLGEYKRVIGKKPILFLPLGTIEWHGDHLPLGTDGLTAHEVCKRVAKKTGGLVMPPLFFGTGTTYDVKGKKLQGMDAKIGYRLPGSMYYLTPETFRRVLMEIIEQARLQKYKAILLLSGHWSAMQIKMVGSLPDKRGDLNIIKSNVVNYIRKFGKDGHADESETSFLIALRPDLKKKINRKNSNTCWKEIYGYDPFEKLKLADGKKMVKLAVADLSKKIKSKL